MVYEVNLDSTEDGELKLRDHLNREYFSVTQADGIEFGGNATTSPFMQVYPQGVVNLRNFVDLSDLQTNFPTPRVGDIAVIDARPYLHDGTSWVPFGSSAVVTPGGPAPVVPTAATVITGILPIQVASTAASSVIGFSIGQLALDFT